MENLHDTAGLIDNRNTSLWDSLKGLREIEIVREKRSNYSVFSEDNFSVIHVNIDDINPASFIHELLHVKLKTKGVYIGNRLVLDLMTKPKLKQLFNDELSEHIGNCLEHIRMLPEFIGLGYDPEEFISDFSENKLSDQELAELKLFFKSNHAYSLIAFRQFVGKYFATKACPNKSYNYTERLEQLKKIDRKLYSVLDNFMNAWLSLEMQQEYYPIVDSFLDELDNWTRMKVIK